MARSGVCQLFSAAAVPEELPEQPREAPLSTPSPFRFPVSPSPLEIET